MVNQLFTRFAPAIRSFDGNVHAASLRLQCEGALSVQYAPFDWVNPDAKLIIVGITPGETQAVNALREAQRQLRSGASDLVAMRAAKQVGAFSGELRTHLVDMLDHVGMHRWAGVPSCAALFEGLSTFLQTASVLPHPVFIDGRRYNGTPNLLKSAMLRSIVVNEFLPMVSAIPDAKLLAVGEVPWQTLHWLVEQGRLDERRLIGQLPHPSPASRERVRYFLGRKAEAELSTKTNAAKLDRMRVNITTKLAALTSA